MSDGLSTDEDRDDAAFRARLAPLASEVLPDAATPRSIPPSSVLHTAPSFEQPRNTTPAAPATWGMGRSNPRRPLSARAESTAAEITLRPSDKPLSSRKTWRRMTLSLSLLAIAAVGIGLSYQRAVGGGSWFAVGRAPVSAPSATPPSVPETTTSMSSAPPNQPAPIASVLPTPAVSGQQTISDSGYAFAAATPPTTAMPKAQAPFVGAPDQTAATEPPGSPAVSPGADMIGLLMRRGDAALAEGDIIAARLMFERAANLGSGAAAAAAGRTYDIDFLLRAGARGIRADPAAAARWYRRAAALEDPGARARLPGPDKLVPR